MSLRVMDGDMALSAAAPWVGRVVVEFDALVSDDPHLQSVFPPLEAAVRRRRLATLLAGLTHVVPSQRAVRLLDAIPLADLADAERDLLGHHLLSLLLRHGAGPAALVAACATLTDARKATPLPGPAPKLWLNRSAGGHTVRLIVAGELDLASESRFREALANALAQPLVTQLILDFEPLLFLDARGLAALFGARHRATRQGIDLRVVNDHGPVRLALKAAGWRSAGRPQRHLDPGAEGVDQ